MKNLRWDLISLPIVAVIVGVIAFKVAGIGGSAGGTFMWVWIGCCFAFFFFWLFTGQLKK